MLPGESAVQSCCRRVVDLCALHHLAEISRGHTTGARMCSGLQALHFSSMQCII